jgi:hypothetical protein
MVWDGINELRFEKFGGIGTANELGHLNSIGKDLTASGRFNICEDVRWTSFAKTFDVVG